MTTRQDAVPAKFLSSLYATAARLTRAIEGLQVVRRQAAPALPITAADAGLRDAALLIAQLETKLQAARATIGAQTVALETERKA